MEVEQVAAAVPREERIVSLPAPACPDRGSLAIAAEDLANTLDGRELGPKLVRWGCDLTGASKGILALKERGGWGYRLYPQYPNQEGAAKGRLVLGVSGLLAEVLADGQPRQGGPPDSPTVGLPPRRQAFLS